MKEATGELSMTVVTIVAIVAIAAIIYFLRGPMQNYVNKTWSAASDNAINVGS